MSKTVMGKLATRKLTDEQQLVSNAFTALLEAADLKDIDRRDLQNRGYTDEMIEQMNFKSMPKTMDEATELTHKVLNAHPELEDKIRDGVVPGFFVRKDTDECCTLWEEGYYCPAYDAGAIADDRNYGDRVLSGIQYRKTRPLIYGHKEGKYMWLAAGLAGEMLVRDGYVKANGDPDYSAVQKYTEGNRPKGVVAAVYEGSDDMYVDPETGQEHRMVIITEGVLKSSLAYYALGQKYTVIGLPGVNMLTSCHEQIKDILDDAIVVEAFDADKDENSEVLRWCNRTAIDAIQDNHAFASVHMNWDNMQNQYAEWLVKEGKAASLEEAKETAHHDLKGIDDVSVAASRMGVPVHVSFTDSSVDFIGGLGMYNIEKSANVPQPDGQTYGDVYGTPFVPSDVATEEPNRKKAKSSYQKNGLSPIIDNVFYADEKFPAPMTIPPEMDLETVALHAPVAKTAEKTDGKTLEDAIKFVSTNVADAKTKSVKPLGKFVSFQMLNTLLNGSTGNGKYRGDDFKELREAISTIYAASDEELMDVSANLGSAVPLVVLMDRKAKEVSMAHTKYVNRELADNGKPNNYEFGGNKTLEARAAELQMAKATFNNYAEAVRSMLRNQSHRNVVPFPTEQKDLFNLYAKSSDQFKDAMAGGSSIYKMSIPVTYENGMAPVQKDGQSLFTPMTETTAKERVARKLNDTLRGNGLFLYGTGRSGISIKPMDGEKDTLLVTFNCSLSDMNSSLDPEYRAKAVAKSLTMSCMYRPDEETLKAASDAHNRVWKTMENNVQKCAVPMKNPVITSKDQQTANKTTEVRPDTVSLTPGSKKVLDVARRVLNEQCVMRDGQLMAAGLGRSIFSPEPTSLKDHKNDLRTYKLSWRKRFNDVRQIGLNEYDNMMKLLDNDALSVIASDTRLSNTLDTLGVGDDQKKDLMKSVVASMGSATALYHANATLGALQDATIRANEQSKVVPKQYVATAKARCAEAKSFFEKWVQKDKIAEQVLDYNTQAHRVKAEKSYGPLDVSKYTNIVKDPLRCYANTEDCNGVSENMFTAQISVPVLTNMDDANKILADKVEVEGTRNGMRLYSAQTVPLPDKKEVACIFSFGEDATPATYIPQAVAKMKRSLASHVNQGEIPERSDDKEAYSKFWKRVNMRDYIITNGDKQRELYNDLVNRNAEGASGQQVVMYAHPEVDEDIKTADDFDK